MSLSRFLKRRQRDDLEAQPVEQIGAEPPLLDQPRQMLVGRGDDADVDLDRPAGADPRHLAIFDRAQQPVLRRAGEGRQLVEEERAAIGLLEPPLPGLGGAGEAACLVAEQFRLDQRLGERGAVHHDQAARPSAR